MKWILKLFLLLPLTYFAYPAQAINIGFNQAWFKNNYSTQYLNPQFDAQEVERIFHLAEQAGSQEVRLWFFESSDFPMILIEQKQILNLKTEYIENVIEMLKIAKKHHIKIYMTIFDAHTYRPDLLPKEKLLKLKNLFSEKGTNQFLEKIVHPLFSEIEEQNLGNVISKIDITNEVDAIINRLGFEGGWNGAKRMLCQWKKFLQRYDQFKNIPITFSLRLHPLIFHPKNLLNEDGPLACADFIDFHSYHDQGEIYRCHELKKFSETRSKKLIMGEFGQGFFTRRYSDVLQLMNTFNYLKNLEACGFTEALAWRLSDIREGYNKEARYSFESYGRMRPAYYLIQANNQKP
jgi:hypothetical protein